LEVGKFWVTLDEDIGDVVAQSQVMFLRWLREEEGSSHLALHHLKGHTESHHLKILRLQLDFDFVRKKGELKECLVEFLPSDPLLHHRQLTGTVI
jgi:hypothetical protein